MRIGIHQPNYLPWLGYFRKISQCDVFVFFDNVQMPGGKSFVSRNAIKTANGRQWLTVPVSGKGEGTTIHDAAIVDQRWSRKHLKTLEVNYAAADLKALIADELAPILSNGYEKIADLNIALIERISRLLGLNDVRFARASELSIQAAGADSILEILGNLGATVYCTGSGAGSMRHLDEAAFAAQNIAIEYVDGTFMEYPQMHGAFEASLSIIDALLNCGPEATRALLEAE
jgi:hypothetical protein